MVQSRRRTQNKGLTLGKQLLLGGFILISVLVFSGLYFIELATSPFVSAKEKAEQVAKDYADIQSVSSVSTYNGSASYYSLVGENTDGQEVLVLIATDSSDIFVYQMDQGISQEEAESIAQENGATTVDKVTLGYEADQPIWEVKSGTAYYLIGFESGELIKKEGI